MSVKKTKSVIFLFFVLTLVSSISTVAFVTGNANLNTAFAKKRSDVGSVDGSSDSSTLLPAQQKTLTYTLKSGDSRTIIPVQMKLPNGQWSQPIKFNFDTGASHPTDVPLELLSAFGVGPDGVPRADRKEQLGTIKIVGLNGVYNLPIEIQDKAHYDLFRSDSNRYPLLRIRDITNAVSMVFTNKTTTLRVSAEKPPELIAASPANVITLPDMKSRSDTPTSGWQWQQVKFSNPSTGDSVTDWFGLNTGDVRIVMKKSLADSLALPLAPGRKHKYFNTHATMEFIESAPTHVVLSNIPVEAREDSADFGRGGMARNFGSGLVVMDKFSIAIWGGLHWALISTALTTQPPPPSSESIQKPSFDTSAAKTIMKPLLGGP